MFNAILNKYWGYQEFRPNQQEIIESIINGKDTLAILPTGGGKSICFQLPALIAEGVCIVISPLIALMQDQVANLLKKGISAAFLSSSNSDLENDTAWQSALRNEIKLLYIAPERLLSDDFKLALQSINLSFIAVDEAHCISQWGHDFRPAYRRISDVFKFIRRVPIIALTASATPIVQQDIVAQLNFNAAAIFKASVVRPNLSYQVITAESKITALEQIVSTGKESIIIYCNTRKQTEYLALHLRRLGYDAQAYHAGLHKVVRRKILEEWTGKNDQIICATAAFGMGIDKPNVRTVIHWDLPMNLEAYYQEAGRAGRDGKDANCILLFHIKDANWLVELSHDQFPSIKFIKEVYYKVLNFLGITLGEGLDRMYGFKILDFVNQYQLPVRPTLAAIKLLQKNGYWQWNETDSIQSKLQIIVDAYTIEQLSRVNTKLALVTQAILRLYGGVFYFPTTINEFDLAKKIGISKLELDNQLKQLHNMGIVDYAPATVGGTLYMLSERIPENYFKLNEKLLLQLKQTHFERLEHMINYIEQSKQCRSVYLARYFGEENVDHCGKCDICLESQNEGINLSELKQFLLQNLGDGKYLEIAQLEKMFGAQNSAQIIEYLRFLVDEGWIEWNIHNATIILKK